MERHYQSGRENGECRFEFRCAEAHSDRRRILRRRALCHVRQSLRPAFCFRLAYGKIRRHEWRRRRRNAGRNQSEATRAQRQEVERRRKKRTFRFHKENIRRANRPALRRPEIMASPSELVEIKVKQLERSGKKLSDEERKELFDSTKKTYEEQTDPRYGAARLWIDKIIDPMETRQAITQALEAASLNPDVPEFKVGVLQT